MKNHEIANNSATPGGIEKNKHTIEIKSLLVKLILVRISSHSYAD
jgi:hypothetical protein